MSANGERSVPRPTIHDVAEHAGVSKSLVSLVLRGSPKVGPDRRAAVDRAIAELGYRPNAAARTLREGRSRAIGVLLNDVRHPWFIDLLDGLISVVEADGRHLVLSGGGRLDRRMDDSVLRGFLELEVDGFILAGTQANSPVIGEIANVVPTITVGWRDIDLPRVDTVANDDLLGATLATRHLIELGHRRIAHISGRVSGTSNVIGKLRQQGYEDTMRACGLGEYIRVEPGDFTEDAGYRATVRLLNSGQPPTAIFAVDDMTCLGAQSAASEMNVAVPGRLSLVGYDNSYLSRLRSIWLHQRRQRRFRSRRARRPHAASPGRRAVPPRRTPPPRSDTPGPRIHRTTGRTDGIAAGIRAARPPLAHRLAVHRSTPDPRLRLSHIDKYHLFIRRSPSMRHIRLRQGSDYASMFDRFRKGKFKVNIPNGWWCMPSGPAPPDPGRDEDPARASLSR